MNQLQTLVRLMEILGNVTLQEAIDWAQVEENAERLRGEGHEGEEDE